MQWGTYEFTKSIIPRLFPQYPQLHDSYAVTAVSGASAAFMSTVVTNPLDVMRIKKQCMDVESKKDTEALQAGYFRMLRNLVHERGVRVLFKGLSLRLCISMPASIVAMCGYETVKEFSALDS